ncbi:MAG: tagaturonate reductase [Bacteroidota bacterium]|nr:tagaturonate reductase [Bacteroidota bacterium]
MPIGFLKKDGIPKNIIKDFMILSRYTLKNISPETVDIPGERTLELPEKVLQFGTGVLLRGLPDYFINKANQKGIFNGRIVVVKSTSKGNSSAFEKQDGLYTLCVRGLQNGKKVEENIINASVNRVLSANEDWEQILECAHNKDMQVIISNTTEVGIQLVNDDIRRHPPVSFPGKLLAFLYERYKAFNASEQSGMVIIPAELISDNGKILESIVLELAHLNGLEETFIEWLECCNHFCNSLVDRIVTGKPAAEIQEELENELGYKDELLIMSEAYRLWAIEGDKKIKDILSFAEADGGVIIEENIEMHKELKLRLLNGTHTLSCGLAFLAGCDTVKQAMDDEIISSYISNVMQNEIAPAIPYNVDLNIARDFGAKVLDRFRNPHINHQWINITVQLSSKMKMRCVPLLLRHYKTNDNPPELMALGFAAYLYFMKAVKEEKGKFYGELNGEKYLIQDDAAEIFMKRWKTLKPAEVVRDVLRDNAFWGESLNILPGFQIAVTEKLSLLMNNGAKEAIEFIQSKKEFAA